jgi:hypothetical protein
LFGYRQEIGDGPATLEHLHPHTSKHPFSINLAARYLKSCCSPVLLMIHFAVVILTPLKAFFYYGFGQ